ncbi:MAG: hypothetical protein QNJ31_03860 [Candidatus Caenarcaniphilales bacterium]|nr:hypothetical protein [Candidatus Caenarcaniphilales bacterium]
MTISGVTSRGSQSYSIWQQRKPHAGQGLPVQRNVPKTYNSSKAMRSGSDSQSMQDARHAVYSQVKRAFGFKA